MSKLDMGRLLPHRLTAFLIVGVALVFGLLIARQLILSRGLPHSQFAEKKLRVLTYATFMGNGGPGPRLVQQFKARHQCEVEVVTVSDAGLLLEREKLASVGQPFDVVLGLDQLMLKGAAGHWRSLNIAVPGFEANEFFVPYDWSPLTFIYRRGEIDPPRSVNELSDARFKGRIALEDPRTSSPGAQFVAWLSAVAPPDFLAQLSPSVQSVASSWALAYGLFMKKQVDLVWSYVTSLAYHWEVEHQPQFQAASFKEGHPVQIEYAGVPATCGECALAEDFVRGLLDLEAQQMIMEKNFMFPVIKAVTVGTVYERLPELKTISTSTLTPHILNVWDQAFKH